MRKILSAQADEFPAAAGRRAAPFGRERTASVVGGKRAGASLLKEVVGTVREGAVSCSGLASRNSQPPVEFRPYD